MQETGGLGMENTGGEAGDEGVEAFLRSAGLLMTLEFLSTSLCARHLER